MHDAITVDTETVIQILREIGASEIMPLFRNLSANDIEMKGVGDPVTIADKAAEKALAARLTDLVPHSLVVGEEACAQTPGILASLDGDQPIWLIDPIDGTSNFIAGRPEFAIMVAFIRNKRPIMSWIHDPNSGDTITAEEGSGVWLREKKLTLVAPGAPGIISPRLKKLLPDLSMQQTNALPRFEFGSCAGFDYPRLFTGDTVFADTDSQRVSFLFYPYTKPWDHVPGLLMHREAGGGYSADWLGQPYNMIHPGPGLLVAPDKESWETLHSTFRPLIQHVLQHLPLSHAQTAC